VNPEEAVEYVEPEMEDGKSSKMQDLYQNDHPFKNLSPHRLMLWPAPGECLVSSVSKVSPPTKQDVYQAPGRVENTLSPN